MPITGPGLRPSRSELHMLRGLRIHIRRWGRAGAPKLFLLHGWRENPAIFQFIADALRADRDVRNQWG